MKKRVVSVMAIVTVIVGGCGSDESSAGDVEEFCRLSAESNEDGSLPTSERLESITDAAPPEIRDDVEVIIDALTGLEDSEDPEELGAAFDDPEVAEAIERVEAFETENCD